MSFTQKEKEQIADYLRMQYPDVLFHSDTGSLTRLTPRQGAMRKRQNGGRRGWPDMFIAKKRTMTVRAKNGGLKQVFYGGLFIELKREGTRLKKKNGEWASAHIAEQAYVLSDLQDCGYKADFAIGFDEAKKIIDEYLGGKNR